MTGSGETNHGALGKQSAVRRFLITTPTGAIEFYEVLYTRLRLISSVSQIASCCHPGCESSR
jgi:hypothetical protein